MVKPAKGTFLEIQAALNVNAVISSSIPDNVRLKFISLNDDAVTQAIALVTAGILAYQWENYTAAAAAGKSKSEVEAAAVASEAMQAVAWQLMNVRSANLDGVAVEGETLSFTAMTVQQAIEQGLPVKSDSLPDDPYLFFTIPKGEQGEQGEQGIQGEQGEQGPPGECEGCEDPGPGSQPDGGGGGATGTDGGGSGPGGEPNPDGGDKIVYIGGCADPIINFPYCSASFSFSNADIRAAITDAVESTGKFNPVTEDLISVVLDWGGAAYAGIAELTVSDEYDYLGPHSKLARLLTVEDAEANKMVVPHDIEEFGVEGVLVVQGYHYDGTTGLRMQPVEMPIVLNGEMSTYPILGGANCSTPPDANDPAWLKCCLRMFIKHAKASAGCTALPIVASWLNYEQPDPYATLAAPADLYGSDGQPITNSFDSRAYVSNWSPPSDGYLDEHMTIALEAGQYGVYWALLDNDFNVLSDLGFQTEGIGDYQTITRGPGDFQAAAVGHVMMYANQCYKIMFDQHGTGRWQPYHATLEWA